MATASTWVPNPATAKPPTPPIALVMMKAWLRSTLNTPPPVFNVMLRLLFVHVPLTCSKPPLKVNAVPLAPNTTSLLTFNVPPNSTVPPPYVLVPVKITVPGPTICKVSPPEPSAITPGTANVKLLSAPSPPLPTNEIPRVLNITELLVAANTAPPFNVTAELVAPKLKSLVTFKVPDCTVSPGVKELLAVSTTTLPVCPLTGPIYTLVLPLMVGV